ncbi:ComEA family DNA-binding protein [Acinetobacter larvae]|uniref:Competence protein ComE n=1 Tax=Acinetobacter larvae TaxID=1789224 RepID=A0A1B2M2C5_9GAMM|nr:ComEA family DNA-binding protein [Acinetobacter larvae]AOA59173.1 hypothetical protein BFG52_12970 [Acinetobacter larvae]
MKTSMLWRILAIWGVVLCSSSTLAIPSFDLQYRQWKFQQEQYDRQLMSAQASASADAVSPRTAHQAVAQPASPSTTAVVTRADKVCVNHASIEQLQQLIGVGNKKAAAIIAYRQQHGPFQRVEDLLLVKGLGEVFLEKNRKVLCL